MEDLRGGGDAGVKPRKDKENRTRREKEDKAVTADMDEVERRCYSTGKATVEVSVKLKRRKSRSREHEKEREMRVGPVKVTETGYRKGSWGDLLTRMKSDPTRREITPSRDKLREKMGNDDHDNRECRKKCEPIKEKEREKKSTEALHCWAGGSHSHAPKSLCRKIPISSDLYLETHTHIIPRDKHKKEEYQEKLREKKPLLGIEDKLESEMSTEEKVATFLGVKKNVKGSSETLRLENEALRSEACELLEQMKQAKKEQQESIMTIKELYQLAELLKKENQKLVGTQEEQQELTDKLVSAKNENEQLREYVQALLRMQNAAKFSQSDHMSRLEQLRHVIQEVKSTIQEEIEEITTSDKHGKAEPLRETLRGFDLNLSDLEESALLNDTNASEIQKILGSYENSGVSTAESIASRAYLSPPPPPEEVSLPSPASIQQKTSTPGQPQPRTRFFRSVNVDELNTFQPIREVDN